MLDEGQLEFKSDVCNKSPYEDNAMNLKKVKINTSSLAEVTGLSTNAVMFILKKIVSTLIQNTNIDIKLNMRIGYLKVVSNRLIFESNGFHSRCFSTERPFQGVESPMNNYPNAKLFESARRTVNSAYSTIRVPESRLALNISSDYISNKENNQHFINASNPNPQSGNHRYPRNNQFVMGFQHQQKRVGTAKSK